MKAFAFAVLALVAADAVLNHGGGTATFLHSVRGFLNWLAQVRRDSIFTR